MQVKNKELTENEIQKELDKVFSKKGGDNPKKVELPDYMQELLNNFSNGLINEKELAQKIAAKAKGPSTEIAVKPKKWYLIEAKSNENNPYIVVDILAENFGRIKFQCNKKVVISEEYLEIIKNQTSYIREVDSDRDVKDESRRFEKVPRFQIISEELFTGTEEERIAINQGKIKVA